MADVTSLTRRVLVNALRPAEAGQPHKRHVTSSYHGIAARRTAILRGEPAPIRTAPPIDDAGCRR
jgi:hypothetical protein